MLAYHHALLGAVSQMSYSLRYPNSTYCTTQILPAGSSFTMECWVKAVFVSPPGYQAVEQASFLFFQPGNLRTLLRPASVDFSNLSTGNTIVATPAITPNVPTHVRFTYDAAANTARVDVNNVAAGSMANFGAFGALNALALGNNPDGREFNPINGLLDEARIWPYVRTQAQNDASWHSRSSSLADITTAAAAWPFDIYQQPEFFAGYADVSNHQHTLVTSTGDLENEQVPSAMPIT